MGGWVWADGEGRTVAEGDGAAFAEQRHLQTAGRDFLFLEVQQRGQRQRLSIETLSARCDAAERDRSISGRLKELRRGYGGRQMMKLSHVYLPLYSHIFEGICLAVSVVKEELLSLQNSSFGKDSDAVVSIHHHHFSIAVGIN